MATPFVVADAAVAVAADLRQYDADLKKAERTGTASGSRLSNALKMDFGNAQKIMGASAAGLFAVLLKGGAQISQSMADYRAETGATAEEAEAAQKTIGKLFRSNIEGYESIAAAAAKVKTDLGAVGDEQERLTQLAINYGRVTREGPVAAVAVLDDLTDVYNLTAAEQADILDRLVAGHQRYGGSLIDDQQALIKLGPALNAANMSWRDGTGLINLFNAAGVDSSTMITAFNRALSNVQSPEELQRLIADITATEDPFKRAALASELFGAKAGPKMAQVLAPGSAALGDYVIAQDEAADATKRASDAIASTPLEQLKILLHNVLGPMGEFVAANQGLIMGLTAMPGILALVSAAWTLLSSQQVASAAGWVANAAAVGIYNAVGLVATATTIGLRVALNLLLGPIGWIILAVGALFVAWETNLFGIRDLVDDVVAFVREHFGWLIDGIELVGKALGAVLDFVSDVVDGIHDFLFGAETAVGKSMDTIKGSLAPPDLRDDWKREMGYIGAAVQDARPGVARAAAELAGEIPTALEKGRTQLAASAKWWLTSTIGQQLVAMGPAARRSAAQISLDLAGGLRDKRSAIDTAIAQLKTDIKNKMSLKKEVGHDIGLLFGKTIAKGLRSSDPVVKAQAEGTRALIEAQLIETVKAGGVAGEKIQAELEKKLKSKDPAVKAQAQRTKSLIDAALAAQPAKSPGDAIGDSLNKDLGSKGGLLYRTAYDIGRTIYRGIEDGVKGRGSSPPRPAGVPHQVPVDSFDVGTSYVPHDMLAMVHKGEIIHSPEESDRIRKGLNSGPLVGELNVDARGHPDAAGVGRAVERAVGDAMANVFRDESLRGFTGVR